MDRIKKLLLLESPTYIDWVIYFTAFILLQVPAIINFYYNNGNENAYLQFAQSLIHGNLYLPDTADPGDLSFYNGKLYLPYPPLPAILLMPFVALFGTYVNTVAVATLISCCCLYLLYNILSKLKVEKESIPWLIVGVFFGTGFWLALFTTHHVYAFAHVVSFLFQLLFINEILGKRRWWLVGLFIGCAFLSRQFTIFYVLFALGYMWYVHRTGIVKIQLKDIVVFALPIGILVGLYLLYNYARFGNALDSGYTHIDFVAGILKKRVQQYGVFSARYFLYNLYCTLVKGFNIQFQGETYLNIKDMDLWGTSLFSASPFLIASFKSNWPKILRKSAWSTILIILVGQLFYHNNGYEQVNTSRFTLDFLPLLIVLTSLGLSKIPNWLIRGMIIYAVGLNVLSFIIHLKYQ